MDLVFLAVVLSSFQLCYGATVPSQDCTSLDPITSPLTKIGNKCYYFETIAKANWFSANYFCNFHGMRLASIRNEEENTALGEHLQTLGLPHDQRIWTSGSDLSRQGSWYWSSTGRRFTYTNWRSDPQQPDNAGGDERCLNIELYGGLYVGWNDLPCALENPFICENTQSYKDSR